MMKFNSQTFYRSIGQRIRELRRHREMNIRQLADAINLDAGIMGQIERGVGVPSLKTLALVAKALNVPLAELFKEDHQRPSEDFLAREATQILKRRTPRERRAVLTLIKEVIKLCSKN